jgi:hypothetical protein
MRIGLEYDINIMGHWHQELLLPRAIVCNTLKGFDEYARLQSGAKTNAADATVVVCPSRTRHHGALAGLHRAERIIAERLTRLANGALPWPWINADKALPWVEKRIGFALAESQVAAIRLALISKALVIGGPGRRMMSNAIR